MRSDLILFGLGISVIGFGLPSPKAHLKAFEAVPVAATPASPVHAAVTISSRTDELIENALERLSDRVVKTSDPAALRRAFRAYYSFKAAHPDAVRNPYLYFVDYGLDNRTPRGYVFDMDGLILLEGPFIVAHGRGSSRGKNAVPMRFSNSAGSSSTSLGLYLTAETYAFTGHAGGRLYKSIGLRLDGRSGRFNNAARARGVVVHGAPYVTPAGAGRSQGCPAMEPARARRLIPKIANGGIVFLFSPNDETWLQQDPWANAAAE